MSGGTFDYQQYRIHDIADRIQEEINHNNIKPQGWDEWCGEWTGQLHSDDVINIFKDGVKALRIAAIYAQRIDWFLAGDDGEESFKRLLTEELAEIK